MILAGGVPLITAVLIKVDAPSYLQSRISVPPLHLRAKHSQQTHSSDDPPSTDGGLLPLQTTRKCTLIWHWDVMATPHPWCVLHPVDVAGNHNSPNMKLDAETVLPSHQRSHCVHTRIACVRRVGSSWS